MHDRALRAHVGVIDEAVQSGRDGTRVIREPGAASLQRRLLDRPGTRERTAAGGSRQPLDGGQLAVGAHPPDQGGAIEHVERLRFDVGAHEPIGNDRHEQHRATVRDADVDPAIAEQAGLPARLIGREARPIHAEAGCHEHPRPRPAHATSAEQRERAWSARALALALDPGAHEPVRTRRGHALVHRRLTVVDGDHAAASRSEMPPASSRIVG
ncbi:hypothetical protein ASG80_03695 [Agromyces sp. Soil535]|nr:hypothetical protein ASG80_03695 [Agromyces sp. Soil535]